MFISCSSIARQCALVVLLFCNFPSVQAETHALLVGVGDYAMGGDEIDLPGIDEDISMMRSVVRTLGVKVNNVQVYLNSDATRKQVVSALKIYAKRLKPTDDLLVYFSTHGIQIVDTSGDELDGADEALALYDLALHNENGEGSLKGILTDDELGRLLSDIPSRRKVIIIDACHSGTMSKSLDLFAEAGGPVKLGKSLYFPQLSALYQSSKNLGLEVETVATFDDLLGNSDTVVISAARDFEEAVPSESGSLFTKSLSSAINVIKTKTPYCWYQSVQRVVTSESRGRQNPVFLGGFIQSNQLIGARHFNYMDAARAFTRCNNAKHVQLASPVKEIKVHESLRVSVKVKHRGWFYLLAVQKESIAVLPWDQYFASSAAQEVYPGEQLSAVVAASETTFQPGPLLILGIWVQNNPEEHEFNWSIVSNGDFGELSTATLEFNITQGFGS